MKIHKFTLLFVTSSLLLGKVKFWSKIAIRVKYLFNYFDYLNLNFKYKLCQIVINCDKLCQLLTVCDLFSQYPVTFCDRTWSWTLSFCHILS